MMYTKVIERVNPTISHHKEKKSFFFFLLWLYEMMDVN